MHQRQKSPESGSLNIAAARRAWQGALTGLLLLLGGSAEAATIAVAPIKDGPKRGQGAAIADQVVAGLGEGGHVALAPTTLADAAKAQGLSAKDLARPPVLMPVAQGAGAQAVVSATVEKQKGKDVLQVRVFDLQGAELWSRPIPLERDGKLGPDIPRKIAKAVSAALVTAGIQDTPKAEPKPAEPEATPEVRVVTRQEPKAEPKPEPETKVDPEANPEDALIRTRPRVVKQAEPKTEEAHSEGESEPPPKPKRRRAPAAATGEGEEAKAEEDVIDGPPEEKKKEEDGPGPPLIDGAIGFTLSTRSYKVCPGVASCSEAGPEPTADNRDVAIDFKTQSPYGGFTGQAELFPLPRMVRLSESLTLTAGVTGEFSRSLALTSKYADPVTSEPGSFRSSEQRIEVNAAARLYFRLLGGTGYAGAFGGFASRLFAVDDNPVVPESRRLGAGFGAQGEIPLAGDYVKVNARFALLPALNPGIVETTLYGQTGQGGGFDVRGGLTGGYKFIGYSALASYTSFADAFDGAGDRTTNGGVATESYLTFYFLLHGRY